MKGDFSRWTFDRKKHYNAVLKQQGRVDLDADWNEQAAIENHRARVTTQDVIGPCGVPRLPGQPDPDGFKVKLTAPAFRCIRFVDSKTAVLVCDSGLIESTTDGGKEWVEDDGPVELCAGKKLSSFSQTADGRWVAGARGLILFHNGKQWQAQDSGVSEDLHGVWFDESGTGLAVGDAGTVLVSENRGETWERCPIPVGTSTDLYAVCAVPVAGSKPTWWVVGTSGTVRYSSDLGGKWSRPKTVPLRDLNGICFAAGQSSEGLIVGESGTILQLAQDPMGGAVEVTQTAAPTQHGLRAVHAIEKDGERLACAVGENGTVLVWDGKTWTQKQSGTVEDLDAVCIADAANVWAAGAAGTILHSREPGQTWEQVEALRYGLTIAPGHIYVGGFLCECEEAVAYASQPDYSPGPLNVPDIANRPQKHLVYLDVWDRHITALEDPELREPALGGPDTATRIETVWQAKVIPGPGPTQTSTLAATLEALQIDLTALADIISADSAAPVEQLITRIESNGTTVARGMDPCGRADEQLRRALLAPTTSLRFRGRISVTRVQQIAGLLNAYSLQIAERAPDVTCCFKPDEWAPSSGRLAARTEPSQSGTPCELRPDAGYSLRENQLYRVEVHEPGKPGEATFKWSRDNGSVVVAIDDINGQIIHVRHAGRDRVLGFAENQWVEVSSDLTELSGHAGTLVRVAEVDHVARTVKIDPSTTFPGLKALGAKPQLRRWDSVSAVTIPSPTATDAWMSLEGGIQVKFSAGTYKAGDYWLITARPATGGIEWPKSGNDPAELPPLGIEHHYCPLAVIEWKASGVEVKDCRRFFYPLATSALHVVRTSWRNDSDVELDTMGSAGLKITFDGAPRADTVSAATVIVRMEVPRSGTAETAGSLLEELIVTGDVSVPEGDPDAIVWKPAGTDDILSLLKVYKRCRVRFELKGHSLWREACGLRIYLDGQTFGCATKKPDDSYGTDLVFPSGRGDQASNFESWFWVLLSGSPTPSSQTMFVDESGAQVSSYLEGDRLYVKVVDPSHAGATSLANAVTIGTQAYGLTPLAGATNDTFITTGLDLNLAAGAAVTATYKDPRDPTDTSSDTVTIRARKRSERVPRARGDVEPEGRAAN